MWSMIENGLQDWFYSDKNVKSRLPQLISDVESGDLEPTIAASQILKILWEK